MAGRVLARVLYPEVFALNAECREAMVEADRLLGAGRTVDAERAERERRIAQLKVELAMLESAA